MVQGDTLVMFGRVPLHSMWRIGILIHTASVMLGVAQGFKLNELMTHFVFYPKGYGVNLLLVYVIWIGVILLLYPFCRWVADAKARGDWWLVTSDCNERQSPILVRVIQVFLL